MTERDDSRPDPDAVLARVQAEERHRPRLKIFFGFAPGVGKTFAMLEAAARLKAQGVDVVVGLVETHGRQETAHLVEGLEVLPRKALEYRGHTLQEFDLEGALARRPQVLLVDELAHTNVEGSRHARRWQDILELLDAGVEVHTTLNVQHVESLNDVVAQITHVHVRETVPDSILERADEIELVDVPPEELLKRLADGKVYLGERAADATEHFFRRGNLLALRELALRRTADRVDADVVAYRRQYEIETTWPAGERLLVCVGPAPASARLVRAARRMAERFKAPWYALWVESPLAPLSKADEGRLAAHLILAASLGGEVVRITSSHVADSILEWGRSHNVTRIILGKPTHSRLRDRLRGSLLDALVRGSGDIDVFIITGEDGDAARPEPGPTAARKVAPLAWIAAVAVVAATTALTYFVDRLVDLPAPEMTYLLGIMLTAATLGRGPALLTSALSVAAYDFFFVEPLYTFAVGDTRFALTFGTMFAVGVIISTLTSRLRRQEVEARDREQQTRAMFALTRELAAGTTTEELAQTTARHCAAAIVGAEVVVLLPRGTQLQVVGVFPPSAKLEARELGVAEWVHQHQREAGSGTDTLAGARAYCVPLQPQLGVVALTTRDAVSLEDRTTLLAFARHAAVSFERFRLADEARSSTIRARAEELRSALLSTVSHDLRTPLAVIIGAATTLREGAINEPSRAALTDTICDEAERLERLVRNLLDMTRVQAGALNIKKEWIALEELIGTARTRLRRQLEGREVHVTLPPGDTWVMVDAILFEQVLQNLLENALKYTPQGTPLDFIARRTADGIELELADRGPGVDAAETERLFEKFYRSAATGRSGAGLGLAVCRGIVEAHGGTITARRRDGGGARFIVSLPVVGTPPPVPIEDEAGA